MRRLLLIFMLALGFSLSAEVKIDTLTIYFKQGSSAWDATYKQNEARTKEFIERIKEVQGKTGHSIVGVLFHSNTSPEGTQYINKRLGDKRAESIVKRLAKDLTFADSVVKIEPMWSQWDDLHEYIHSHDVKYQDELCAIISDSVMSDAQKERKVRALRGGQVWHYLLRNVFPDMRYSQIRVFVGIEMPKLDEKLQVIEPEPAPEPTPEPEPAPAPVVVDTVVVAEPVAVVEPQGPFDKIILKTNTIGIAMLMANVGVEYQHKSGLAFHLPVYYSAVNYFTRTYKARTFLIQPEVRYYIPKVEGLFVGGHFGLAWYNIALGGDWRYQDHNRNTPAIGGGVNIGYKMPISKNKKWGIEFSLGAGAYELYYDKFINEQDGKLAYSEKRTFIGVDNAAVSFTYTFDLK